TGRRAGHLANCYSYRDYHGGYGFRYTYAAFASPSWYASADLLTNGSSNDCAGAGILVIGFTSRLELTTHQRHYGLSASYCGGSDFGYWCWRGIWQSAGGIGRRQSPCQHVTND